MRIAIESAFIFLLLLANGVFSMAEIAVVSSRRPRLRKRAEEGDARAAAALALAEDPDDFLSTVQIGITLVGILAGVFGGATIAETLGERLNQIELFAPRGESIAVAIVVAAITFLSVVVGELVPKRIALANAEAIAALVARPMQLLSRVAHPVVALLSASASGLMRILPVRESTQPAVTDEELTALLALGTKAGTFHQAEAEMVKGVLTLGDRRARLVMTPRHDVVWLNANAGRDEIRRAIVESGFSRFPVGDGSLDEILGVVDVRDIARACLEGAPLDLRKLMRPPLMVPDSKPAVRVLEAFRREREEIAIVIDEYGSIEGIVTMGDLAATVLGDDEQSPVVQRADGSWLVDGMMKFDEVFEQFPLPDVGPEEYDTLAGFLVARLGRLPRLADRLTWGRHSFEIVDMDGHRVDRVAVTKLPEDEPVE